ncbi:hypothetical protein AJ80_01842 [Polytolypa hystricis UAMH7299]|uniref:SAC domain-containing protein n=1 Tax=Polytolypa hystricis (strain UAMH7299) TaxID=1447883 RepID=A0A2B7Z070_POLH7|nr:hypothetical protein AJ80_01842 [Polytolypa hystricis UAMH7299]
MPGLMRKLLIVAAVDGLILQPYAFGQNSSNNGATPIQIEYKTRRISSIPSWQSAKHRNDPYLESHGVIGLLSVSSYQFLISISKRQQVAQILGKPIFVITGVSIIPLSSQAEATKAIQQAQSAAKHDSETQSNTDIDASDSDSDTDRSDISDTEDGDLQPPSSPGAEVDESPVGTPGRNSIAEDVIKKQGRYARFASRWFSKRGWEAANNQDPQDGPIEGRKEKKTERDDEVMELDDFSPSGKKIVIPQPELPATMEETRTYELLPKLLRYTKMMFGSRNFYYSYDYDITRVFGSQDSYGFPLPAHKLVDPLYFWNSHLASPFIESGQHAFALPLIQGFVGQKEFTVQKSAKPAEDQADELASEDTAATDGVIASLTTSNDEDRTFLLTLISRRSVKRPGLRYLRRGVDDEGNTANTVETEQILSSPTWNPSEKVYSLLQLRGSMPLYFSQSPYYFKPTPILRHSAETNQISFKKHFHDISRRYGKIQAVSLIDKHGVENKIGETYESFVRNYNKDNNLNSSQLGFEWFDFHSECRGMKFENVHRLVESLADKLDDFGYTVIQNQDAIRNQSGIVRTNCMDCLDRTGVTQCAFAQRALEQQLESEGCHINLLTSTSTQWFNILWADNGDAISKQYSSTAALKGDYTRTRKRDYRGALNDLGLTLSRYFNNIVNDYFSQACIDYLLGNVTTRVFDEFEADLMSADPGISIEKAQQSAIETSCQIVISDETEELVGGWTMLSPHEPNTLRTLPFEQSVLLLTNAAVYCCRFDWDTDKVTSFERIELRTITGISYGTYITSTFTEAQMDPNHNMGFVISYRPGKANTLRVNTRSLQSLFDQEPASKARDTDGPLDWDISSLFKAKRDTSRFMAFKALPHKTSRASKVPGDVGVSEKDSVRAICEEIERTMMRGEGTTIGHVEKPSIIEENELISLADARKRTGYLEHLVFDIKKLVWA